MEDLSDVLTKREYDDVDKVVRETFEEQVFYYFVMFCDVMGKDICDGFHNRALNKGVLRLSSCFRMSNNLYLNHLTLSSTSAHSSDMISYSRPLVGQIISEPQYRSW